MSTTPDALDDLLSSLPSASASPSTPKPEKQKTTDPLSRIREKNPDFADTAQGFIDFAKRGGVDDAYIKSGVRSAKEQHDLFTNPKTHARTKGNDGYIKLSPHQEGRAIDWSTKNPANRNALHNLIASYAKKHKLYVPSDEPWHMAGHPNKLAQGDTDELDALMRTVPLAQSLPATRQTPATQPPVTQSDAAPPPQTAQPAASLMGDTGPATVAPPKVAMPTEPIETAEKEAAQTTLMPGPQGVSGFTGNVGKIVDRGPRSEAAYREFLQRNVPHVKGKATSSDELFKDETMATVFAKMQDFVAANPKAGPHAQARALAQIGIEFLHDPSTKGKQIPKALHAAILEAKLTPEEMQGLPRNLQAQIQQHKQQQAAARNSRSKPKSKSGPSLAERGAAQGLPESLLPADQGANFGGAPMSEARAGEVQPEAQRSAIISGYHRIIQQELNRVGPALKPLRQRLQDSGLPPEMVNSIFAEHATREPSDYVSVTESSDASEINKGRQDMASRGFLERVIAQQWPRAVGAAEKTLAGAIQMLPRDPIARAQNGPQGDALDKIAAYIRRDAQTQIDLGDYKPSGEKGMTKAVVRGLVNTGYDVSGLMAKMAVTGFSLSTVMAGDAALLNAGEKPEKQALEVGKAWLLGKAFELVPTWIQKGLGKLPGEIGAAITKHPEATARTIGAVGFGGAGGAETALRGGSKEDIVAATVSGALAGGILSGGGETAKEADISTDKKAPTSTESKVEVDKKGVKTDVKQPVQQEGRPPGETHPADVPGERAVEGGDSAPSVRSGSEPKESAPVKEEAQPIQSETKVDRDTIPLESLTRAELNTRSKQVHKKIFEELVKGGMDENRAREVADERLSTDPRSAKYQAELSRRHENRGLMQFVRDSGGMTPGGMFGGEAARLGPKETGTTGLLNKNARTGSQKMTPEYMMDAANEEGYRDLNGQPFERIGDFLDAVESDTASGVKRRYTKLTSGDTVDFDAEERLRHETQQEEHDADARITLLENDQTGALYDKIADGTASEGDISDLRKHATDLGISPEGTENLIASARAASEQAATTSQAKESGEVQGTGAESEGVVDAKQTGKEKALQGETVQAAQGTSGASPSETKGAKEAQGSSVRSSSESAEDLRRTTDDGPTGEEKAEDEKPVTLQTSVLPGAKEFVEQDVMPTVVQAGKDLKTIIRGLVRVLAPRHGVARDTVDAIMKMKGDRDKADFMLEAGLKDVKKYFEGLPQDEQVAFVDRMKVGESQPNESLQRFANFMREIDKQNWEKAHDAGIPIAWLENHYRVLWKEIPGADPSKPQRGFRGIFRRPLRGSRGMIKAHTLASMSEGIEMGGVPVSYNPAVMFELAQADLMKFITAQKLWNWGKKNKLIKWVREGKSSPEGFTAVDDSIAKRYFRGPMGSVKVGEWHAEEGYGRLLNNYLSKDYLRDRGGAKNVSQEAVAAVGRSLLWVKNTITAAELGLSAFHATFESGEAVSSQIGRALRRIYNLGILQGDPKEIARGAGDLITSPLAPFKASREGGSAIRYMANKEEFLKTTRGDSFIERFPEANDLLDDLFTGGGRLAIHEDYLLNWRKNFREAIKQGNYIGAIPRAAMAANEWIMHPLFETYIPRLKIGAFLREHSLAIAENQKQLESGKVTRAELARKTWDFVEDRFGEMNFDNLFWDRTLKTSAQIMFRSTTWKLGNLRGVLHAPVEQGREVYTAVKEGRMPRLAPKMAWLSGMSLLTAAMGSVIMKGFTGRWPKDLYDYIYPQIDPDDDKQRVSMPTYARDEVALYRDPKHYLLSSLSSEISRTAEVWANKDFYGEEVFSEDDPIYKEAWDVTKHYFPMPFSVSSYLKFRSQGEPSATQLTGFIGFPKAPAFVSMTPMDEVANEYYRKQEKVHGRPKDAAEKARVKRNMVDQMRHGRDPGAALDEALQSGTLLPKDFKDIKSRAALTPRQLSFRGLPLSVALEAYEKGNAKQRAEVKLLLTSKLDNAKPESFTPEIRKQVEDLGFVIPAKLGPKHPQSEQRKEHEKEKREKKSLRWIPPSERPAAAEQIQGQGATRRRYMVQPR